MRQAYVALFSEYGDDAELRAIAWEAGLLVRLPEDQLPSVAKHVMDTNPIEPSDEYWRWLIEMFNRGLRLN